MDIEKNNDDINSRKRTLWGKNSLLHNANANHHSQRKKRSAIEQRLNIDIIIGGVMNDRTAININNFNNISYGILTCIKENHMVY